MNGNITCEERNTHQQYKSILIALFESWLSHIDTLDLGML